MFFLLHPDGHDPAAVADLPVAPPAPRLLPQVHSLQRRECRLTTQSAHGMQDVHEDDEGVRKVLVNTGPAAIEYVRKLAVGRTADIHEVADAHESPFGKLGKQSGKQQSVFTYLTQLIGSLLAMQQLGT